MSASTEQQQTFTMDDVRTKSRSGCVVVIHNDVIDIPLRVRVGHFVDCGVVALPASS